MFFTRINPEDFNRNTEPETPEQKKVREEQEAAFFRSNPHLVIIDGTDLVKVIEDNPDLPVGEVTRLGRMM